MTYVFHCNTKLPVHSAASGGPLCRHCEGRNEGRWYYQVRVATQELGVMCQRCHAELDIPLWHSTPTSLEECIDLHSRHVNQQFGGNP